MSKRPTFKTKAEAIEAYTSGGRQDVLAQAKSEHAAVKAAKASKKKAPATPALDALNEASERGIKPPAAKKSGNGQRGRSVNIDTETLITEVIPGLFAEGHTNVNRMVRALRNTKRGTNANRMRLAFAEAVERGLIDPASVKAEPKAQPKAKATAKPKARTRKAPAKRTRKAKASTTK